MEKLTFVTGNTNKVREARDILGNLGIEVEQDNCGYPELQEDSLEPIARHGARYAADLSGKEVIGYRAASYSINSKNLWAHDVLLEEGFKYSSSVYPVKHDLYGIPDAPRFCYKPIKNSDFLEIPITTVRIGNKNVPCGGGGFFRFYLLRQNI